MVINNVKQMLTPNIPSCHFCYLQEGGGIPDLSTNRRVDNINAELSFEKKIDEYLRRKNAKKHGLFDDEIDMGIDYYEDFDIEDAEGGDNLNFYDYSDFIANNDPGVYQGNHRILYIHKLELFKHLCPRRWQCWCAGRQHRRR